MLKKRPEGMSREESFHYYQSLEPAEMFEVKEAMAVVPERACIFRSLECEECGEATAENMLRLENGRKLCLDCFHAYSRFDV